MSSEIQRRFWSSIYEDERDLESYWHGLETLFVILGAIEHNASSSSPDGMKSTGCGIMLKEKVTM